MKSIKNSNFNIHFIEAQHIVCGSFHAIRAELNSYDRDSKAQKAHKTLNIYCLILYGKV